jgi:hypothetical protein
MAKYRKFIYNAGYVGTETEVIMKFADSYTDKEIEEIFNDWIEDQHNWSADCVEVDESDIDESDLEDEYE